MGGVSHCSFAEGLPTLPASAAAAAVILSAAVAGIGVGVVDTYLRAQRHYLCFAHGYKWAKNLQLCIGALPDSFCHSAHELLSAIRVDGVVAGMCSYHQSLCPTALRHTCCHSQKYAIAERHHCLSHALLIIIDRRDSLCAAEQCAAQVWRKRTEINLMVRDTQSLGLTASADEFSIGVIIAVAKAQRAYHRVLAVRPVQSGR